MPRQCIPSILKYLNVYLTCIADFINSIGEARLLSSSEQVLGKWEVVIHKQHKSLFDSLLFPEVSNNSHESSFISSKKPGESGIRSSSRNSFSTFISNTVPSDNHQNVLKCILSIEQDGAFSLSPLPSYSSDVSLLPKDEKNSRSALPKPLLRGQWKLESTCYCVTDRHYDNLSLVANPRARLWKKKKSQKQATIGESSPENMIQFNEGKNFNSVALVERACIELRCKVWGRYGSQVVREILGFRQNRGRSRMTHGTILAIRSGSKAIIPSPKWYWWKRRIILGSFTAKAIPSEWEKEYEKRYWDDGVPGKWMYRNRRWMFVEEEL